MSTGFGFIGLGVMGEPMCRHLATRLRQPVRGLDRDPAPLARLASHGVLAAADVAAAAAGAEAVFLSLPSGEAVEALCRGPAGLLAVIAPDQVVVDLGTSPVDLTRTLAAEFAARGAHWADAPVARTRAAAEAAELSVMVGAGQALFGRIEPWLRTFASEVTLCGPVGSGQVVKILNNLVLFETVLALSEARVLAARAGVDPELLFRTLSKGSADSFALRNHGLKAIIPGEFPERAFPVSYARKDLSYARRLAADAGLELPTAAVLEHWFERAREAGLEQRYFPVISRLLDQA